MEELFQIPQRYRFSSKSQHRLGPLSTYSCCFRYHKGTDFQANHNSINQGGEILKVVLDTTKVQIFKQITTKDSTEALNALLFQIPQRYRFSSKSQHKHGLLPLGECCFRYHKGTDFQANHNVASALPMQLQVVLDTTKVQIFKQITTLLQRAFEIEPLFQIPQRYRFSSKSQQDHGRWSASRVVLDTTKVQIFKQITTQWLYYIVPHLLFQIPQRYRFSSKSQHVQQWCTHLMVVLDTTKVQIFKQITTYCCQFLIL